MGYQPGANPGNTRPTVTPTTTPAGNHWDAQGNWVDGSGNILVTAAQVAAGGAKDPASGQPLSAPDPNAQANAFAANDKNHGQYGNGLGGLAGDLVTAVGKDNPVAGTVNAGIDLARGQYQKAGGDFTQGYTFGTVPIGGNNITTAESGIGKLPGTVERLAGDAGTAIGNAASTVGTELKNGLKGIGGGGGSSDITTADADAETQRANALADALGPQAGQAGAQADTDRGLGTQTRAQQEQSISDLQDAAAGRVASPAELQLKQQASVDAARQYGLAAALQGNNPAAALRQASLGSAQVAGTTDQNAAILRATETANARNALANSLTNVRAGDQGAVNTDVNQQGTLTQGQLTSQGQGVTSTGQKLTAEAEKAKADALKTGALYGAYGATGAALLSDKRAKKDIAKADLADALAKGVHGVTYSYKPEAEEDDAPHFGLLADELERVVPGVVKRGPIGIKVVDTGHLTAANTSIIAELARRLMELEKGKERRA